MFTALPVANASAATPAESQIESVVARTVRPLMEKYAIAGMAIGIVENGRSYVFNYGVASKATAKPVSGDTLFEVGSVTKTFTATLAAYAQVTGKLSLSNAASTYLPTLRGSAFGNVTLVNLGTHTPGGVPLQVPEGVTNDEQLMTYFRNWKPAYAPGSYRTYSNLSIGLLGVIVAKTMNEGFAALMEGMLFPALGMKHSFINVPSAQMSNYAQGYKDDGAPIRLAMGELGRETYGVRTTAGDLVRYIKANMRMLDLDPNLQRAIVETHTGYYQIGGMTQDLIWEQYAYPVDRQTMLAGNSAKILLEPNPAVRINPPTPPADAVLINKTGSTNGFGTYIAFVPAKKFGIVLLANKAYPIPARVTAAYTIMTNLSGATP